MKQSKIFFATALTAFIAATTNAGSVYVAPGQLWVPNADGSFSSSYAPNVNYFACLIDQATYATYQNDSLALYCAYTNGVFASAEYQVSSTTDNLGYVRPLPSVFEYDDDDEEAVEAIYYAALILTYDSAEYGKTYFIAEVLSGGLGEEDDPFEGFDLPRTAKSWSYIPDPTPSEPPSITCTAISVASGTVTLTYSISDYSRLSEIVQSGAARVRIAADITGATDPRTVEATLVSSDSEASTFTLSFSIGANWTHQSMFIFGTGE